MTLTNIIELFILFIVIAIFYVIYDYTSKKKRLKYLYFDYKFLKINQLPIIDVAYKYLCVYRYKINIYNLSGVNLSETKLLIKFCFQSQILKINTRCKQGNNLFTVEIINPNSATIEVTNINIKEAIKLYIDVANCSTGKFDIISCTSGVDFIQKEITNKKRFFRIGYKLKSFICFFKLPEKYKPQIITGVFAIIAACIPLVFGSNKDSSNHEKSESIVTDSTTVKKTLNTINSDSLLKYKIRMP